MPKQGFDVLVVEDEPAFRQSLVQLLKRWGYRVRWAADGHSALLELERRWPDMVLTDLIIPGKSGYMILKYVQEHCPDLPVLVMTAYASLDSAIEALKQGAYDYLLKPVTGPELQAALGRASATVALRRSREREVQLRHIAEVAITLAHEINNPLGLIIGELQLRLENGAQDAEEQRALTVCLQAAQRITATIRRLAALREITYEEYEGLSLLSLPSDQLVDSAGEYPPAD